MIDTVTDAPAKTLRRLFDRLDCFRVINWGSSSKQPASASDRVVIDTKQAHVVSSRRKDDPNRHTLVLDIDHPAWLVASSTPGHYHLYIDVPGGIDWKMYNTLIHVMRDCGILEPGYVSASQDRGHTDVRLPWIKKEAAHG